MPLGAFKLNSLSKIVLPAAAAEEYFVLYTTSRDDSYNVVADADNNMYLTTNASWLYKVDESGSVAWRNTITSTDFVNTRAYITPSGNVRRPTNFPYFNFLTYPYGYVETDSSSGSITTYLAAKSSSGNSGNGNTSGNLAFVTDDGSTRVFSYRGQFNFFTRVVVQKYGSWAKALNISEGNTRNHTVLPNGNVVVGITYGFFVLNSSGSWTTTKEASQQYYGVKAFSDSTFLIHGGSKIVKTDTSGSNSWVKTLSITTLNDIDSTAIDSNNNTFTVGVSSNIIYIYKINSSGNLAAKLRITVNGSAGQVRINVSNDNVYVSGVGYVTGTTTGGFVIKLPNDLAVSGTYGNFVFSEGTHTISNSSESWTTGGTPGVDNLSVNTTTHSFTTGTPTAITLSKSVL